MTTLPTFSTVYGPVLSWRYGRSLGIDPIGPVSTCSFNCVYCQLGEIETISRERQVFIPTQTILQELADLAPWEVDIITLSGSGEPTLALNLEDILQGIKTLTHKPILVLTNATQLGDPQVRQALSLADKVSVKLDGISEDLLRRVNRPTDGIHLNEVIAGIQQFSQEFPGEFSLQTMLLSPWSAQNQRDYVALVNQLKPREIQLNTPTRPKPIKRELSGRGNHFGEKLPVEQLRQLKCVSLQILETLAQELQQQTGIPVRYAPSPH